MMSSANVDLQEIAKFQALAEKWWDTSPKSEFYPLHQINPLRLNWISDYCGSLSGKKLLILAVVVAFWQSPWRAAVRMCWAWI